MLSRALVALAITGCATSGGDETGAARKTVNGQLSDIAAFRASKHTEAALAALDHLLKQLAAEGGVDALAPKTRSAFERELEASRAFVSQIGMKEAAAGHPLAAEAELAHLAPLLAHPELADATKAAKERVREAGKATCARLQTAATSDAPYWAGSVSRYCAHFDVAFTPPAPARELPSLVVEGALTGVSSQQAIVVSARVQDWLQASLWTEPGAPPRGRAKLSGKVESSSQSGPVTLHASYEDTVVSHAINGQGSVEENPIGRYFGQERTASATMDRVFTYDAEEARGRYSISADVSLDLGDAKPVTFSLRRTDNLKAREHDVTFEKAGIVPVHERLPSTEAWLDAQLERMSKGVLTVLNRRFIALHCSKASYDLDEAARCLIAGQKPSPAVAVVSEALGEDADRAAAILRPAPPSPPKAAAPARPGPRKASPRPSGAQDDENPVID